MLYFKEVKHDSSEGFVYVYTGLSRADLEKLVTETMTTLGYKHLGAGTFEKGNRTMRLLFGAFCKYFKFQISVDDSDPQNPVLMVSKGTTGISGGAIGYNQVKNELGYMKKVFQTI